MRLTAPFDEVLAGRSHVRVLRALDALPNSLPASVREIARRARVAHPTASRVLTALAEQGVVTVRRYGRADLYELNRRHELYEDLRALFEHEARIRAGLRAFLKDQISRRLRGVRQAYLFGSAARDDMKTGSDIDLALVAPGKTMQDLESGIALLADDVRRRFGGRLSVIVASGSLEEMQRSRRHGRELWKNVSREGVPLLGSL